MNTYFIILTLTITALVAYPRILRAIAVRKMAAIIQDTAHVLVPPLFIQSDPGDDTVNDRYNAFVERLTLAWDKYKETNNTMDRPNLQVTDLLKPRIRETAYNTSAGSALHFYQWYQEETNRYNGFVSDFIAKRNSQPFTVDGERVKYQGNPFQAPQRSQTIEFSINSNKN